MALAVDIDPVDYCSLGADLIFAGSTHGVLGLRIYTHLWWDSPN
jgi:hypothetical protein